MDLNLSGAARSKTLSYWLRHRPDAAKLLLDEQGWTDVEAVLAAFARAGTPIDAYALREIVEQSDKQHFELTPDGHRIRARQGHTVTVALDWPSLEPPELLYHGTVGRSLDAILAEGLQPMQRHHVHLSPDVETARRVGGRRGAPVILAVHARKLHSYGTAFFLTGNNVWLTDAVPTGFLEALETPASSSQAPGS